MGGVISKLNINGAEYNIGVKGLDEKIDEVKVDNARRILKLGRDDLSTANPGDLIFIDGNSPSNQEIQIPVSNLCYNYDVIVVNNEVTIKTTDRQVINKMFLNNATVTIGSQHFNCINLEMRNGIINTNYDSGTGYHHFQVVNLYNGSKINLSNTGIIRGSIIGLADRCEINAYEVICISSKPWVNNVNVSYVGKLYTEDYEPYDLITKKISSSLFCMNNPVQDEITNRTSKGTWLVYSDGGEHDITVNNSFWNLLILNNTKVSLTTNYEMDTIVIDNGELILNTEITCTNFYQRRTAILSGSRELTCSNLVVRTNTNPNLLTKLHVFGEAHIPGGLTVISSGAMLMNRYEAPRLQTIYNGVAYTDAGQITLEKYVAPQSDEIMVVTLNDNNDLIEEEESFEDSLIYKKLPDEIMQIIMKEDD